MQISNWPIYIVLNLSTAMTGFLNSCFWIGGISSFPFSQIVADKLGRKKGVFFGAILILIAAILQGAARNCELVDFFLV